MRNWCYKLKFSISKMRNCLQDTSLNFIPVLVRPISVLMRFGHCYWVEKFLFCGYFGKLANSIVRGLSGLSGLTTLSENKVLYICLSNHVNEKQPLISCLLVYHLVNRWMWGEKENTHNVELHEHGVHYVVKIKWTLIFRHVIHVILLFFLVVSFCSKVYKREKD